MTRIIQAPRDEKADYDYIAFSFKGKHSFEDFGIYRVSNDQSGYNMNLNIDRTDKTAQVPGSDGLYYFGNEIKSRVFNVAFAFDNLPEEKLIDLKNWLSGDTLGDLWFSEEPYKVYTAKVTGLSTIKTIPFEKHAKQRSFSGTGQVTFTCYYPYGQTPDFIKVRKGTKTYTYDGKGYTGYSSFFHGDQKLLPGVPGGVHPYGDLPFHFIANLGDLIGSSSAQPKIATSIAAEGTSYVINSLQSEQTEGTVEIGGQS